MAETSKEDTIRYIRGYDILCSDSECARTYYHYVCDEGGSTSHILNETGKVLNQYEYDAFGNLIKAQEEVNNRFLYVGQQYDGVTMQYYLRARYYNPVVARFTQEDTYRGDGLNLYAYCRNNPVGYYDPSGYNVDDCGIGKNGHSKNTITGPNGTQITPEYDELAYGGYYGRKDKRRQSYSNNNQQVASQSNMQQQVEKGQAPNEIDRVDKPHVNGQKPHVHFKDGTSLNYDGTVHDKHNGIPKISNKVRKWLEKNGWKGND